MKKRLFITVLILIGMAALIFPHQAAAQSDEIPEQQVEECKVLEVLNEEIVKEGDIETVNQELRCELRSGDARGEVVTIETGKYVPGNKERYDKGDLLQVSVLANEEGELDYVVIDYVRKYGLILLFLIFIILAVAIGKKEGILSIVAMSFTFLVVMKFMLPRLLEGANPVFIVILSSLIIIPVTFYLSHGLKKETTIAVLSTLISLFITGVLAQIFIGRTYLQGISSEEAAFLNVLNNVEYDLRGLLLGGIIISVLGVLDDITIAQSDIISQLHENDSKLEFMELYKKGMRFGKNHIASMINTLVLVYAGASIPLLLMFMYSNNTIGEILNIEIIASELVNMLIGSIGLILAVPITTFFASFYFKSKTPPDSFTTSE